MKYAALGDIAKIERTGVRPEDIRDGTIYVGLENIVTGGELTSVGPVANGDLASSKFAFCRDHILYGKLRPYLAKIAVPAFEGVCSTDILPIRVGNNMDKMYVAHYLRQSHVIDQVNGLAAGANLPRVSPSSLETIQIPMMPVQEQRRIAAILDKADELRTKRRQAIAHLDTLTQSIFHFMFGDPAEPRSGVLLRPIEWMSSRMSDGPFGSNLKSSHYVDTGVRVIRLQNIGNGEFINRDAAYIQEDHFASISRHECRPGDVLIGTLGDPNLRACVQPAWLPQALNKADCLQLRVNSERADPTYVAALLNNSSTRRKASGLVLGQTRGRISLGRLRSMIVPVPPFELQQTFATRVAAVERLKEIHRKHLVELDALFASLQSRAFKGEL